MINSLKQLTNHAFNIYLLTFFCVAMFTVFNVDSSLTAIPFAIGVTAVLAYVTLYLLRALHWLLTIPVQIIAQSHKKKRPDYMHNFTYQDAATLNHRLQNAHTTIGDDGEILLYHEDEQQHQSG